MNEYTPTTEDVFRAYQSEGDGGISNIPDHSREAFDRWLYEIIDDAWYRGYGAAESR